MTVRRFALVTVALLLVAAVVTVRWLRRDDRVNVLLVIVDTLRADHVGCYGYAGAETPTIDALAASGTRFSRVVTAAPVTAPSVATILTSTHPIFHGVHDNEFFSLNPSVPTIAAVFRDAGYRTGAIVGAAVLDRRFGLDAGFDYYDDDMSAEFPIYGESYAFEHDQAQGVERRAENVTRAAIEWIEKRTANKPFFCMVHYFDPHMRYDPPPPFRERFEKSPYDGEVAYTDSQVGVLLDALTRMGKRDNTLVVFTADHGEGLGEHGEGSHGYFLYDSTTLVPLIFNLPGGVAAGVIVDAQVRSVDVVPTVLELAGMNAPETTQGLSLAPVVRGLDDPTAVKDRTAYLETFHTLYSYRWHELQGIRTPAWKYVRAPEPELYDLVADPDETVNVIERETEQAEEMDRKLAEMVDDLAQGRAQYTANRPESEPEVVEKMRTLGYVGTDTETRNDLPEPGGDYPDPKAQMKGLNARHEAKNLLRAALVLGERGDIDGALEMVESAEALVPRYAEVVSTKGFLLSRKGRLDEGIRLMEEAIEMSPGGANLNQMLNNLGVAYLNKQDYEKAVDRLERALATLDVSDAKSLSMNQTLSNLGIAYLRSGDCNNAIDALERSLEARYDLRTVLNMCSVYEKCGQPRKAADRLEQALRDNPNLDPKFAADVRRKVGELRAVQGRR